MAYSLSTIKLLLNPSTDAQIVFTEYFYRRLSMALVTGWDGSASYQINNSDTLDNTLDSGIQDSAGGIDWSKYPEQVNHVRGDLPTTAGGSDIYPIGVSADKNNLDYNFPMFYAAVFGMVWDTTTPVSGSYNGNNTSSAPNYYDSVGSKYNPWYYYDSTSLNVFNLMFPPSWHVNPNPRYGGADVLDAVPHGNLIPAQSNISIDMDIDPADDNSNVMTLDITFSESDIIDNTSGGFIFSDNTYKICSMAIVDYYYQPLILATFPIIPITQSSSVSINTIFTLNFGANLLQP